MSLQGSPIEIPKMVDGEPTCGEGYTPELSENYKNNVRWIETRNSQNKKKEGVSGHSVGLIFGSVLFAICFLISFYNTDHWKFIYKNVLAILNYFSGNPVEWYTDASLLWSKLWQIIPAVIFASLLGIFAWLTDESVKKDKTYKAPEPEPIPEPTESDYFCKKIPEPEPEDDTRGSTSSTRRMVFKKRRRSS